VLEVQGMGIYYRNEQPDIIYIDNSTPGYDYSGLEVVRYSVWADGLHKYIEAEHDIIKKLYA
jgi:hypothetical protein